MKQPVPLEVNPLTAALTGLALAARRWPVLLALWLGAVLNTLPFLVLPGQALLSLIYRPVLTEIAAHGPQAWQWLDLLALIQMNANIGQPEDVLRAITGGGLIVVLLVPIGALVAAFLYGGALLTYREAPLRFDPRRFAWGGWHWMAGFSLLAFIQALAIVFLLLPVLLFTLSLAASLGPLAAGLLIALVALLLVVWLAVFEQARVLCVANDTRNPLRGLKLALGVLLSRPLPWLGIYAFGLLGLAAVHALFRLALLPALLSNTLLTVLAQQVFIIVRLYLRAARLAGGMKVSL